MTPAAIHAALHLSDTKRSVPICLILCLYTYRQSRATTHESAEDDEAWTGKSAFGELELPVGREK